MSDASTATDASQDGQANGQDDEHRDDDGAEQEELDPKAREIQEARQADRVKGQRIKALEAELERLRKANLSDKDRAIAEARDAARAEADAEWSGKFLGMRVERLAAAKLADPTDATRLLDLALFDGDTTDEDIVARIDELLERKPYLAASSGEKPPPKQVDRGAQRTGGAKPGTDMNELLRRRR